MRTKGLLLTERMLIAIGLLLVVLPQVLRYHIHISDFMLGTIIGIGLALEITALIRSKKFTRSGYF